MPYFEVAQTWNLRSSELSVPYDVPLTPYGSSGKFVCLFVTVVSVMACSFYNALYFCKRNNCS